eukprot:930168-Rhodomonas_salina.2
MAGRDVPRRLPRAAGPTLCSYAMLLYALWYLLCVADTHCGTAGEAVQTLPPQPRPRTQHPPPLNPSRLCPNPTKSSPNPSKTTRIPALCTAVTSGTNPLSPPLAPISAVSAGVSALPPRTRLILLDFEDFGPNIG